MKKLLLSILICIISLSLFACSSANSPQSTNTEANTNSATDTSTSTSSNGTEEQVPSLDDYTKISGAIQPKYTLKYSEKEYYTRVDIAFGSYTASDLPSEYGEFYKVVKSYERFVPLVEHGNFIEESVFEEYNMLLIYRNYGGRYSSDVGFSNFKYEGGHAYIDLYEYTGNMDYPDCNFSEITYLLIPKEIHCYEKDFAPISLSKTKTYSYNFDYVDIKNINLGDRALIFTNEAIAKEFETEYGIHSFYSGASIVLPKLSDSVISYGYLTLEENKLTLVIDEGDSPYTQNGEYVIIRIPTFPYAQEAPYFDKEIPQDAELEILIRKNIQPVYSKELTKQEWEEAIDAANFAENYTQSHSISFVNNPYNISYADVTYKYTENVFGELAYFYNYTNGERIVHAFYNDFANDCYYEVENAKWIYGKGNLVHDCIVPSLSVGLVEIKASFDKAVFRHYDGTYTIEQVLDYHNIVLKISNSRLVYLSYEVDYIPQRDRYNEYHQIYFYDYDETEIELPKPGQGSPLSYLAQKRAQKVTIDLEMHSLFGDEVEKSEGGEYYAGYIGINANGNEYIEYAPNAYTYYAVVTYNDKYNLSELYSKIIQINTKYYNDSPEYTKIDVIEIGNAITIYFPDFNSYFECQEYMLDELSKIEAVKSINVGYIEAQDVNSKNFQTYETILLSRDLFEDNYFCPSYNDLNYVTVPDSVTEETFDSYYVFVVNSFDYRSKVSDAKIVNNTVYLTLNHYYTPNTPEDAIERSCSFLVLVPKAELGELPEIITVKTLRARILDAK